MATLNPRFKLKDPKSATPSLIQMKVYFNSGRFTYSTGEKILPEYWEEGKHKDAPYRIIYPRGENHKELRDELRETEGQLERYSTEIKKIYSNLRTSGKPITPEIIKSEMDKVFKVKTEKKILNLIDVANLVITDSKDGTRQTKRNERIREVTIKGYTTTLNHLEKFKTKTGHRLQLDRIDLSFYNKFVRYFQDSKTEKTDQHYTANTIGKNIKNIKVFMKEAYRRGLTNNTTFMDEDFRITEEDTDQIYLDTSELNKIYQKDFSKNPRLDRIRDLFIIGCWTGLRFADLSHLSKENIIQIDEEDFLKVKTQKTGETVIIPLHWTVKEILNKYEGNIPKIISNQKMNVYLKEVVKKSEISSTVRVAKTRAGKMVEVAKSKHELVTVHTARRSFASNMYLADFPTISIMKVTGHKTERAFLKYIRISQEENARKIANHEIWKAPLKIAN